MKTRVVNLRDKPQGEFVRIDRMTKWGNPYRIGRHGTREEVIEKYKAHLSRKVANGEITRAQIAALSGSTLACWCSPLPCHGDVLARVADNLVMRAEKFGV